MGTEEAMLVISKASTGITNERVNGVGEYGNAVDKRHEDRCDDSLPFQVVSPSSSKTSRIINTIHAYMLLSSFAIANIRPAPFRNIVL